MTSKKNLKSALESMMFVWGQPLDAKTAADVCNSSKQESTPVSRSCRRNMSRRDAAFAFAR